MTQPNYLRSLYFFLFVGIIYQPFASVFFRHTIVDAHGDPDYDLIGIITAIIPLAGFLASMVSGILADTFHIGKRILTMCAIGSAVSALCIALGTQNGFFDNMGLFFFILLCVICMTMCISPIHALIDAETVRFLDQTNEREKYGVFRLWGTYGWAIGALILGGIITITNDYVWVFYFAACGYIVLGIISRRGVAAQPKGPDNSISWKSIFYDKQYMIFIVFVFISGMVSSATMSYIGIFFESVTKNPFQIGMIFCFWTTLEIPVMLYSKKILTILGSGRTIIAGILLNVVRLWLFSQFTENTPFLLTFAAAMIHGPAFAFQHLGIIHFVDTLAPNELKTTYLSTMTAVRTSIAASVGGYAGAYIMKHWDGAFLMEVAAYIHLFLSLFFWIFIYRGTKKN